MKLVALAGEPGTGKSTLMLQAFAGYLSWPFEYGLVKGSVVDNVCLVGIYKQGEKYPGTDRLSMAVQPDVLRLVEQGVRTGTPKVIVFEGDRLSNVSLLEKAKALGAEIEVFVLAVNASRLEERRAARGDTFDQTWLRGRSTKVANFSAAALRVGRREILWNDDPSAIEENAARLKRAIFF